MLKGADVLSRLKYSVVEQYEALLKYLSKGHNDIHLDCLLDKINIIENYNDLSNFTFECYSIPLMVPDWLYTDTSNDDTVLDNLNPTAEANSLRNLSNDDTQLIVLNTLEELTSPDTWELYGLHLGVQVFVKEDNNLYTIVNTDDYLYIQGNQYFAPLITKSEYDALSDSEKTRYTISAETDSDGNNYYRELGNIVSQSEMKPGVIYDLVTQNKGWLLLSGRPDLTSEGTLHQWKIISKS